MTASNFTIHRNRLARLAQKLSDSQILYVQAPAGYGKTVFAGQWLEDRKSPTALITLDEYDNTAADMCYKLKTALTDLCTEEKAAVSAFTEHPDFCKAPVEFLMRAVRTLSGNAHAYLVIDDLHYLTDFSAQKALERFLTYLPTGIKICILGRNALPECFCELILKNAFQFISQEQLCFDSQEICALYKGRNITLTSTQAEAILSFTEGWPLGINALLLSDKQIPPIEKTMSVDWLQSFLKTHVWEGWDDASREFMLGICMEDELTADLCNVLTGRSDSERMLEHLITKGAFLSKTQRHTYRFHSLFREFLKKLFLEMPENYRTSQIRIAGKWYLEQCDFYHAVEKFSCIKDYAQLACCFDLLEEIDRSGFDTEQVMHAVRTALDEEILIRYPYLYFMKAFTARNEGKVEEFKAYADQYYNHYPQIIARNPELSHNIFFLYILDFRFTLKDIAKMASGAQAPPCVFQGVRGTATLYFPFCHRSFRDFSELLPGDIDGRTGTLAEILGPLLGKEGVMLKYCIQGGLYYEQGNLERAQELAIAAVAELQEEFAPESKFCAMALLLEVSHALMQSEQEELIRKDIQKMIEKDKAFYLQSNFDALIYRHHLDFGDTLFAQKWLKTTGSKVCNHLDFFHLYNHFTTARAHIAVGNFNYAIILLEMLLELCDAMKRPSDVIEAEILLSISFWKKKYSDRKKASSYLVKAVLTAQEFGYEQAFINDGAELKDILSVLKNWTVRSDYSGNLSETFVKRLYLRTAEKAEHSKGLTGGRGRQPVKLTPQQKRVATLMCDGYSYRKIAQELGVQFSTVRSHIELIYRKLDVSSMDEAILKIRRLRLLEEC